MDIMFLENGCTAIFDDSGKQVDNLQIPWFRLFMEYLGKEGIDLCKLKIQMPNGRSVKVIDVGDNEFNWTSE